MSDDDLLKWLRDNSSGNYRPSREAADLIERLKARLHYAEAELTRLRSENNLLKAENTSLAGEEDWESG